MTTTTIIKTRTTAPYAIVYIGKRGGMPATPTIEAYAHTHATGHAKARRMGRGHIVLPVVAGTVTVEVV